MFGWRPWPQMMYTKDEVETVLEFVNDDMRRSVEKELANANHVTALLMRLLMAQVMLSCSAFTSSSRSPREKASSCYPGALTVEASFAPPLSPHWMDGDVERLVAEAADGDLGERRGMLRGWRSTWTSTNWRTRCC